MGFPQTEGIRIAQRLLSEDRRPIRISLTKKTLYLRWTSLILSSALSPICPDHYWKSLKSFLCVCEIALKNCFHQVSCASSSLFSQTLSQICLSCHLILKNTQRHWPNYSSKLLHIPTLKPLHDQCVMTSISYLICNLLVTKNNLHFTLFLTA